MYKLIIPENTPVIEDIIDCCIEQPNVRIPIPDSITSRRLGKYVKPLEKRKLFGIYRCDAIGESIAICTVNDVIKHRKQGRKIVYDFPFL